MSGKILESLEKFLNIKRNSWKFKTVEKKFGMSKKMSKTILGCQEKFLTA